MMSFWREMRRRHVFRIAGIYVAVGWILIEVLANVLPMFEAPDWFAKTVTLLIVLFFPIALIIAWAFEITPDGIKRADQLEDQGEALPTALPDYLILLSLLIVIGLYILDLGNIRGQLNSEVEADNNITSVAVLPFADFSEGGANQYLGNGIAEAVLNGLSSTEGLNVASRTSSFASQHRQLDSIEIGLRLGVNQILEGSIRRQGTRLRVSAQLTDVNTGFLTWSDTYDREFSDIFAIEEDLARAIVTALRVPLAINGDPIVQSGTESVEAYNLALQGRYLFRNPTQENFLRATQLFTEAIGIDPDYWSAHGYLGFCLGYASIYTSYADQVVDTSVSVELALRHDPDNTPALLIKGFMKRNPDSAYPFYQRALESTSDRDLALYVYHNDYLAPQSRSEEARRLLEQAIERDPDSVLLLQPLAMLESRAGNYERALELIGRAGRMDGSDFLVSSVLGDVYYRMGNAQRLREVSQDSIDKIGLQNGFMAQYLIQALVMNGDNELARQHVDTAIALRDAGQPYSATTIGLGLAALGETGDAARWLVQAERERDFWLRWHLKSALSDFPRLAAEPTIESLLERMGLDHSSIQQRKEQGR